MTRSPACAGTQGASDVLWSTSSTSPATVVIVRCSWLPTCCGSDFRVPSKVTSAPARPERMSRCTAASSGDSRALMDPHATRSRSALAGAHSRSQVDPPFIDGLAHYDSGGAGLGHGADVVQAGDAARVIDRVAGRAQSPSQGGQVRAGEGAVPLDHGQDDRGQRQLLPGGEEGTELDP